MSIVTLRPSGVNNYSGVWYNDGSYGPAPSSAKVADANDGTLIYGVASGTVDFDLGDYSLAATERCIAARTGVRIKGDNGSSGFNCDTWFRPVVAGDQPGVNILGPYGGMTTVYTGWYTREFITSDISQFRACIRENYSGVTIGDWADVWAELDIRHQPSASGLAPSGSQSSRTPTASWTFNDLEGGAQVAWQVKLFQGASYIYDTDA